MISGYRANERHMLIVSVSGRCGERDVGSTEAFEALGRVRGNGAASEWELCVLVRRLERNPAVEELARTTGLNRKALAEFEVGRDVKLATVIEV